MNLKAYSEIKILLRYGQPWKITNKVKKMKYLILAIAALLTFNYAGADSWESPKVKVYYSADSSYFVRIVPKIVPERYWKWMNASTKRKERFSPQDTTIIYCHAMMFKRTKVGDTLIWKENLINQISPVSAMVSNDGKYLVTFDNWYSAGYGVDVLVVYDKDGMMLKRHMLEDISPFPVNTYPLTISSLWWRCGQDFTDGDKISICFKNKDEEEITGFYSLSELKMLYTHSKP